MTDIADQKAQRKVVAIIEARMTSSRLPGKVLMKACDKPMLELMLERVGRIDLVDEVVIATTTNPEDDPIVDLAERLEISVFQGSEPDVLLRVHQAAETTSADIVVELTGDCPLIDPDISRQIIETYLVNEFDYVSTGHHPRMPNYYYLTYPPGMDTQVMSARALATASQEATDQTHREHPPLYMLASGKFSWAVLPAPANLRRPDINLSLDTSDDFELISSVLKALYPRNPNFTLADILRYIDSRST